MAKGKKKKQDQPSFNPEPLKGSHQVSEDGEWLTVGSRRFKRTVLPSVAESNMHAETLAAEIESMDRQIVSEKDVC
jgi:hypothetical protein